MSAVSLQFGFSAWRLPLSARSARVGHPAGEPSDPQGQEETSMLKIISAALLAVSFIAAPALAAPAGKTATAPVIKAEPVKSKLLNANARMGRHHHKHL